MFGKQLTWARSLKQRRVKVHNFMKFSNKLKQHLSIKLASVPYVGCNIRNKASVSCSLSSIHDFIWLNSLIGLIWIGSSDDHLRLAIAFHR